MKRQFKTTLLITYALFAGVALAPFASASAAGYAIAPITSSHLAMVPDGNVIQARELPINQGIGIGSNKAMMGVDTYANGTTVTTEPTTGFYAAPFNRDRDYGFTATNETPHGERDHNDAMLRANANEAAVNQVYARGFGPDGVAVDLNETNHARSINSNVHSYPPIGEGSNRATSGLDSETY